MKTTKPDLNARGTIDLNVLCGGYCETCDIPFEGRKRVIHDLYIDLYHVAFCSVFCHHKWLQKHKH